MLAILRSYFGVILLLAGLYILGYYAEQKNFNSILSGYLLAFIGFFFVAFFRNSNPSKLLVWTLFVTLVAIPFFPNLSDDIYRFIWDGYSSLGGINPYTYLPSEIVGNYEGLSQELYNQLNSQQYYSIYPTVSQLFFSIVPLCTDDLFVQAILLKLIYFSFHCLGAWYIYKLFIDKKWNTSNLLFYYANPLVIMEGIGNLHAEINMVSALFIAAYFWNRKHDWTAAIWFSIAVFIKLIPILLLSYFIFRSKKQRYKRYLLKSIWISCILAIPMIYGTVTGGFLNSIDLYFRKFEFNASLYYILRWLGLQISGYNLIKYLGPGLLLIFIIVNTNYLNKNKKTDSFQDFITSAIFILTTYLLFSTTIHPWYLIGLIGLSVFLPKAYIFLWSFLITLTYINYNNGVYRENLWIVALEYILVIGLISAEYKKLLSGSIAIKSKY